MSLFLSFNKKSAFISSTLLLLTLLCNVPQAVSGKREVIDLTGEDSDLSSPRKKHQPAKDYTLQKNEISSLPHNPIKDRGNSFTSQVTIQDRKYEDKSKQLISPQPKTMAQPSFNFTVPTNLANDDDIFSDPIFLVSLQKIENNYTYRQESESSQAQEIPRTTPTILSPTVINSTHINAVFSDPSFLASVDAAERTYQSQKKLQSSQKELSEEVHTKLLNTFESHQDHLFASIKKAKKSILITSHTFSAKLQSQRKLFDALRESSLRNVKVYLYFNNDYALKDKEIDFLEETGIKLSNPTVHSKLLIIDKNLITCGSFDWLSDTIYTQSNKEASLVLEGKDLNPFIQDIWETLKKYNRLSYHPNTQYKIERNFRELGSQVLIDDITNEEYELLTTPHQHDEFFLECLDTAKHKITMCSPFITRDRKHLEFIFPKSTLQNFLTSGKILHIFYRANDENIRFLREHLAAFVVPNLLLSPVDNLHRKTLIVDDAYVEGSFNWLSSARSLEDEYFFMETSFIIKGPKAKTFIDFFYHTIK